MRTRAMHRVIVWLLPLLAARLFVPIGFMVTTDAPGLRLALCPSYAALPVGSGGASHVHHAGMDHSSHGAQSDDSAPSSRHDHETSAQSHCPFALAGSAALCPTDLRFTGLATLADVLADARTEPAWTVPAVLVDRIRGPPLA